MHSSDRRESKNSTDYDLADWLYKERLDWRRRNYRCFSINAVSSFEETMSTNFRTKLMPRLDAKGSGRTVRGKVFIRTIR